LNQRRLEENEQSYQNSVLLRQRMISAVDAWSKKPNRVPAGDMISHLIEGFGDSVFS